jgi:phage shock protein A
MAFTSKSLAQMLSKGRLMVSGIKKNETRLAARGIQSEKLETLVSDTATLNNEQESAKAQLKTITEELRAKMAELKKEMSIDSQIIKADMPQTSWVEFGIQAQR